jgi:hypothetical protein
MQGPVARQGGVVFNAEYDRETLSKRLHENGYVVRNDLALAIAPGHRLRLDILPGEPVFTRKRDTSKKRKRQISNPVVLSSLNLLSLSELACEDDKVADQRPSELKDLRARFFRTHTFMGFAATPCAAATATEARKLFVICTQGIMSVKVDAHVVPGDELVLDFPMPLGDPGNVCCTPMRGAPRDKVTLVVRPFDDTIDVSCKKENLEELSELIRGQIKEFDKRENNEKARGEMLLRTITNMVHGSVRAIGEALSSAAPGQLAKVRLYNRGLNRA